MQGRILSIPDNCLRECLVLSVVFYLAYHLHTFVASFPFFEKFFQKIFMISGSSSVMRISTVWSGSVSTCPVR